MKKTDQQLLPGIKNPVGRPVTGTAMTDAQRKAASRRRAALKNTDRLTRASDDPATANDITLTECLLNQLRRPHVDPDTQEFVVQKFLRELVRRHPSGHTS